MDPEWWRYEGASLMMVSCPPRGYASDRAGLFATKEAAQEVINTVRAGMPHVLDSFTVVATRR